MAGKKRILCGHEMPEAMPAGTELVENGTQKKYVLKEQIGKGGFGAVYAAALVSDPKRTIRGPTQPYVAKIEPHCNGPLFVESHLFRRVLQTQQLYEWAKAKKLVYLGLPTFVSAGSFEYESKSYRFLIMERYHTDLATALQALSKKLSIGVVCLIGLQILYALEYLHSQNYIHSDIKASNILLNNAQDHVYLADFGLARRYKASDTKPEPKRANDGTIEYVSRDGHLGMATRRGDLEILIYNMVEWLGGQLPWLNVLHQPAAIVEIKGYCMDSCEEFLEISLGRKHVPPSLLQLVKHVAKLGLEEAPDYSKCRAILAPVASPPASMSKELSQGSKRAAKPSPTKQRNPKRPASPASPASPATRRNAKARAAAALAETSDEAASQSDPEQGSAKKLFLLKKIQAVKLTVAPATAKRSTARAKPPVRRVRNDS